MKLAKLYLLHIADTAAPREAALTRRPRSSNVQAGGHVPSMTEWSGTWVPRRSLRPTVQPETSPFIWAKSTARTTSPTQHVWPPPGFCGCWSIRLEQFSGPCFNQNATKAAFMHLINIFVCSLLMRRLHWGSFACDALYKWVSEWVEFNAQFDTIYVISEAEMRYSSVHFNFDCFNWWPVFQHIVTLVTLTFTLWWCCSGDTIVEIEYNDSVNIV